MPDSIITGLCLSPGKKALGPLFSQEILWQIQVNAL